MPRVYLNLFHNAAICPDPEGEEVVDLAAARNRAIEGIRSLVADETKRGHIDLRGRIEIANEAGVVLAEVSFTEAFEVHLAQPKPDFQAP